nr:element excision factor XisH family protein [Nodosilinea sp. LEGE 07298]
MLKAKLYGTFILGNRHRSMPARDLYHDAVRVALEKDGWTITDDPLILTIGLRSVFVDLGAEKLIAAERGTEKIAVEVKSFLSPLPLVTLKLHGDNTFFTLGRYKSKSPIASSI